ncbi:hypothetical protein K501DRAFT_279414 [Backusella circina FSU 941]|nr:hypothetical protein K501DRAFT_279414 [Backusella circina FSU 941]
MRSPAISDQTRTRKPEKSAKNSNNSTIPENDGLINVVFYYSNIKTWLEICSFSGQKIYPSKGKTYVRIDSRTFRFINGKAASYFLQRLNPRKIRWTAIYRRLNKKGITEEVQKKRSRRTVKHERAVVGASWDAIRAKRNQKPDARAAARQAAITKSKEAKKAASAAKKAANPAGSQPKVSKQQAKGFAPKAAATSR